MRISRSIATLAALSVLGLVTLAGCSMIMKPSDLDYQRTRVSESGLFRATIVPVGDSIPRGKLHAWTLHLETAEGVAIDSATITVDGGMPQHGHGLPTRPLVTRHLGQGDHLVEGMKFNMRGWWVVKFGVGSAMGADTVVFNLSL